MSQINLPPTVPPTTEFTDLPAELPKWPKVVGILSISWGGFWLLCGGCGIVGAFIGPMMMPPEMKDKMPPTTITLPQVVGMVAGMANAVLLIVAGAMTVGRKRIGRTLHLLYASISIPLLVIGVFQQFQQQAVTQQWLRENPDNPVAKQMQASAAFGPIIGIAFALLILGYVVFLFVWFGAIKRKAEDMGVVPADEII